MAIILYHIVVVVQPPALRSLNLETDTLFALAADRSVYAAAAACRSLACFSRVDIAAA